MRPLLLSLFVLAAASCGGPSLKAAGEQCSGSSECELGLVCDFGQSPAVCASNTTVPDAAPPRPDADPAAPDAGIDAAPGAPDARPDAARPVDAAVDAAVDASVDATVDAM
ncbi:MAG: hypothetical protein KBG28_14245 [Kofleriaceae bacterium]|jgi:hypothetical protein|nr:hypothetical protein [Kofleriaceae bacterium]MBP6835761.1 hypothetical protein [Kofleriaceae bacterium]MBP9205125.1 hypothetical protein [Kofleriaceae bacterium]